MAEGTEQTIDTALESIFGFRTFRSGQKQIIDAICAGSDVLAILPTGGGKSLCYQLPACILDGTCVVVSPLIALMKDQVDAACANGIKAAALTSVDGELQRREVLRLLRGGHLDLLYVSPERFAFDHFMDILKSTTLSFIAIDEAHCICSWGHDFRPDYLLLADIIKRLPQLPVAAFTASATAMMQEEITRLLGLRDPFRYRGSFNRENLFYEVVAKIDPDRQILDFVKRYRGESGIIYRTTRDSVEETAAMLAAAGISALPYHAGLGDEVRRHNQEEFSRDRVDVVVATIAFGMGIDKSNVRYIVHGDLPRSLEHYYQETGRAGRDGEPSHCLLLFGRGDVPRLHYFIDQVEDEEIARRHRIALADMVAFASRYSCRRRALLAHFGEVYKKENCSGCDICNGDHEKKDITRSAQMLLSAVVRTQERFGINYIIDIVRGADTVQIRNFGHDTLKTWGIGRELSKRELRDVFDALLGQEICMLSDGKYPVVKLLPKAQEVLLGTRTVEMLCSSESARREEKPAEKERRSPLFEQLRQLRRTLAEEQGVPPFVIFSDRTLHDMAGRQPCSAADMLLVNGVGHAKLARYGTAFIDLICRYVESGSGTENSPVDQPGRSGCSRRQRAVKGAAKSDTRKETEALVRQGLALPEIASARGLAQGTIAGHIEDLLASGVMLSLDHIIDPQVRDLIAETFERLQTHALGPVVEAHTGKFGYDEAKLVRAWMVYCRGGGMRVT